MRTIAARLAGAGRALAGAVVAGLAGGLLVAQAPPDRWKAAIPRTWDEAALAEWAMPLAGLGVRPTHMSAAEYYAMPVEDLKTYPVYMPGREPAGYWERMQTVGPQPLIEPRTLRTEADWVRAGERVFFDAVALRTFDPKVIAMARDLAAMKQRGAGPYPDGTISALRWVPTKNGVALGFANCSACHLLHLPRQHAGPRRVVVRDAQHIPQRARRRDSFHRARASR